jgi:hypothetical protein
LEFVERHRSINATSSVSSDDIMEHRRRFIFRGNAAAFGGRIVRPKDIVLEAPGSSLPVTGGRSIARIPRTAFDDFFSVESASTFADGRFDDAGQLVEKTHHRVQEDSLSATTTVNADVVGLAIGRKPRLTIGHLHGSLTAKSPLGSGEPAIQVGKDTVIDQVAVNGHRLIVELDLTPFQRCDTHAKLLTAADDHAFVKHSGRALFMHTSQNGQPAPGAGRLFESYPGTLYATIVKSIRWDGDPFPGSHIDHNTVTIPEFGRVYFGELLISKYERRLTMVRGALGSDSGGDVSGSDVQDNGSWGYP